MEQQYQAAYILEGIQEQLKEFDNDKVGGLLQSLGCFDVERNFNNESVENEFTPFFKVIHNQIVRGIPTKPNVFIEEVFTVAYKSQQLDKSELAQQLGYIKYKAKNTLKSQLIFDALHIIDPRVTFNHTNYNTNQLGSDFEKEFLFSYLAKKKASYLSQLFQPQRNIDSIVPPDKANDFNKQQVDFAFESPYKNSFVY